MEVKETCFTLPINPNHFPSKLWRLVNDPQICSICWDSSGEQILIYQEPFEEEVLGSPNEQTREYFKTTSIISFFRQLNLYGFRKVHPDHDSSEKQQLSRAFVSAQQHYFHNEFFKRANPELLVNLKRLTPGNKAKIAAGIKVTNKSTKCFCYQRLNLPKGNFAAMKNDSVLVEETHHNHHSDGLQNVECDRTPESSQGPVMGHGNPGSGFHQFPMNSQCSHQSSCRHIHESSTSSMPAGTFIPHHPHYGFYTPGYHYCNPTSLDSNMDFSQQPSASNVYCGYYPYPFFGHHHYTGQNPNWQAGDSADPRESDVLLQSLLKVAEELQADASSSLLTT